MRISVAIFASMSVAGLALTTCSTATDFDNTANLAAGDRPLLRPGLVDESHYRATDGYYFRTADGGIACGFLDEPFGQPKRPVGCQGTTQPTPPTMQACWSSDPSAAALAVGESAGYLCVNRGFFVATPSSGDADWPVLPVGSSLSVYGFTCRAQRVGVTCRNDATGRGFEIAPDYNRVF
ncbi:hypothetical protein ACQP2U_30615 [Nocardia sp. CA-084685]|uniref:hypothetical protein n=1 Tax=Nocardia sp. CA-084685 TaxID=3239970 RepID=UPI003D98A18D